MRILYLAHRFPYPPNKGDKLRAFRQLEWLSRRHEVWCACFMDDPKDEQHVAALQSHCERLVIERLNRTTAKVRGLIGLLTGRTITESYYEHRLMKRQLEAWSRETEFDAVVAFSSGMAAYALGISSPRRVLDMCDRDSLKWGDYAEFSRWPMRSIYHAEAQRLTEYEINCLEAFDATILITNEEASTFAGHADRIHVVGNGVEFVPPLPRGDEGGCVAKRENVSAADSPVNHAEIFAHRKDRPPGLTIGFVGVMDYFPSVDAMTWFVESIWPMVREESPSARLRIMGRSPTKAVIKLARVPGVEVAGEIADMSAAISDIDVSIAPLRIARGLQNKVLEAMAHAKPVVMTSRAAEGLRIRDGRDAMIADTPQSFAQEVVRLLHDAELRNQMGQAGRQYVAQHHQWDVELARFERIVTGQYDTDDESLAIKVKPLGLAPAIS